ncbi:MAG: hypothetical protein FJZ63_06605 [Chlamydiae bacterium]|nr:hypothetical protein [Chlamydiota bacterium]
MTARVNPIQPLHPPYYHREYSNDIDAADSSVYKRAALVALPFLSLYKPLSLPLSLGMGSTRVYTLFCQLLQDIPSKNFKTISFDVLQTTLATAALASTIFYHPLGVLITTSQDIVIELNHLRHTLLQRDWEGSFLSLTKVMSHSLYLALVCRGGLELAILSLTLQATTLLLSSREEFKQGHLLEACGNLLMAATRMHQGYSQIKLLQRQKEINRSIRQVLVGELHEKWQFPSDHLPVGIEVNGVKIISWNVLNNAYMEWVTTKDSQGLNHSMISDLDKVIQPNGLTQRDLLIANRVASMTASAHVVALQECGSPFLEALQKKLPSHWRMVKSFETPRVDQDVLLFDTSKLTYHAHLSEVPQNVYPSVSGRAVQNAFFSGKSNNFRVINAHIPGDPHLPVKEEFAKYVRDQHCDNQVTVALGDNNFERGEMQRAYEKMGFSDFSLHSPWKSNIDPYSKHSKAIDHLFVAGDHVSRDLKPDEVLQKGNLQETLDLLNKPASTP